MHIEKNVFENIFNMVINMKGKSKDNMKARMDICFVIVKTWSWFMMDHGLQSSKQVWPSTRMHNYLSTDGLRVRVLLMGMLQIG